MHNFYSDSLQKSTFCLLPEHENSRISFICLQEHCQASSRLGCAYCFLDSHQSHVSQKCKILDFEQKIQEKLAKLVVLSQNFEEDKGILERIEADFDAVKKDFLRNLAIIQENLIDFYHKNIKKTALEHEKHEKMMNLKENVKKSSVFLMNYEEIEGQIQVFLDKKQVKKQEEFLKDFLEKHQRIKATIRAYLKDFRNDFEGFFNKLCENHGISSFLHEKPDDFNEKSNERSNEKKTPSNLKKSDFFEKERKTDFFEKEKKSDFFEKTMKKQIKDVISLSFNEKPFKKAHWSEFLKKNAKNFFKIFEEKGCEHVAKAKHAMIFPCCNKAFLCVRCHDKGNSHKWDVKKEILLCYCLKCFTILKFKEEKCSNCLISLK